MIGKIHVLIGLLMFVAVYSTEVEDQSGQNSTVTEDDDEIDILTKDSNGNVVKETFIMKGTNYVIQNSEDDETCALIEHDSTLDGTHLERCADSYMLDEDLVSDKLRQKCGDKTITIYKERACDETDDHVTRRRRRAICRRIRCYIYRCGSRYCYICFIYYYRCRG